MLLLQSSYCLSGSLWGLSHVCILHVLSPDTSSFISVSQCITLPYRHCWLTTDAAARGAESSGGDLFSLLIAVLYKAVDCWAGAFRVCPGSYMWTELCCVYMCVCNCFRSEWSCLRRGQLHFSLFRWPEIQRKDVHAYPVGYARSWENVMIACTWWAGGCLYGWYKLSGQNSRVSERRFNSCRCCISSWLAL